MSFSIHAHSLQTVRPGVILQNMTLDTTCFSMFSSGELPISLEALRPGVESLLVASRCAADVGQNEWWFAIEIQTLRQLGLVETHLRWLIGRKFLFHREEVPPEELLGFDPYDRQFRDACLYQFSERSCFVLTKAGLEFAKMLSRADLPSRPVPTISPPVTAIPSWNLQRKELWVSECLVKRFRVHSPNQESVLEAFQEEGWPERIFDPLQPGRLPETIKSLNRHHRVPLIRFSGDGTGQGVLWEPIAPFPRNNPTGA